MECPIRSGEAAELAAGFVARGLPRDVELAFERHLAACAPCRELIAAQREVWLALDAWTPAPVSSGFDRQLYARIAAEGHASWLTRLFGAFGWQGSMTAWARPPAMPVAAACAALVAAFLLKAPAPRAAAPGQSGARLQIEQVERALDDIDMLKELGVGGLAEHSPSAGKM